MMLARAGVFRKIAIILVFTALQACGGTSGTSGDEGADNSSGDNNAVTEEASFNISGKISISHHAQVDQDVMGPADALLTPSNNTSDSAQTIGNPVFLLGYVSDESGRYEGDAERYYARDEADFFELELLAGQSVKLQLYPADKRNSLAEVQQFAALRLYQYQATDPVASNNTLDVVVATTGRYYIEVAAKGAPVLYTLTISQQAGVLVNSAADDELAFVPGEVLVKFKSQRVAASLRAGSFATELDGSVAPDMAGVEVVAGSASQGWVLKLGEGLMSSPTLRSGERSAHALSQGLRQRTMEYVAELRAREDVAWAEPNYLRQAYLEPADELYSKQWHYPLINLPSAWDVSTGSNVIVAVIDTGIVRDHEEFSGQLVDGYDFVSKDSDPSVEGTTSHGTHVTGTVIAANDNRGVVGVAFSAKVMPIRVLGVDGQGRDSDIVEGIRYAAGLSNASGTLPERRADIINLSLGGPSSGQALSAAIEAAEAAGVIVIAAAGNESTNQPSYPAAYSSVVAVSAVGQDKQLASYSNYGAIDVAAPGGDFLKDDGILSSANSKNETGGDYARYQGTSMAAPHVAGVAALMVSIKRSAGQSLTPEEFRDYLENGLLTESIGATQYYGAGLIDAAKAVEALGADVAPYVGVSPDTINITGREAETSFSVRVGGGSEASVDSISPSEAWLQITPEAVDENGIGRYKLTADRSGFTLGELRSAVVSVTVKFSAAGETLRREMRVLVKNPNPQELASVGPLWVGLIQRQVQDDAEQGQAESIKVFKLVRATLEGGQYSYLLTDVPAGEYFIFASTDLDQDGFLSDYGEGEGEYPVLGSKELVVVTAENISNLDFSVGTPTTLITHASTVIQRKQSRHLPAAVSLRRAR